MNTFTLPIGTKLRFLSALHTAETVIFIDYEGRYYLKKSRYITGSFLTVLADTKDDSLQSVLHALSVGVNTIVVKALTPCTDWGAICSGIPKKYMVPIGKKITFNNYDEDKLEYIMGDLVI